MELGIFARTFPAPDLEENLDLIEEAGLTVVHFNLKCAGLDSIPPEISQKQIREIRTHFELRDLNMVAVSGTFNAINPNQDQRRSDTERCGLLIEEAPSLGTHVVTLCTGTRDPENMWRAHRDNDSPEAWKDLMETLNRLVPLAEETGVVLGIEPELANVINSAEKARTLLDEFKSPALGIVIDGANLIPPDRQQEMETILNDSVQILSNDLIMAHAKDIPSQPGGSQAAGKGTLDWEAYFRSLQSAGFDGPLIMHNLSPEEVESSRTFVLDRWKKCLEEGE